MRHSGLVQRYSSDRDCGGPVLGVPKSTEKRINSEVVYIGTGAG